MPVACRRGIIGEGAIGDGARAESTGSVAARKAGVFTELTFASLPEHRTDLADLHSLEHAQPTDQHKRLGCTSDLPRWLFATSMGPCVELLCVEVAGNF